jgi:hypothetical protein
VIAIALHAILSDELAGTLPARRMRQSFQKGGRINTITRSLVLAAGVGLVGFAIANTTGERVAAQSKPSFINDADSGALRPFQVQLCVENNLPTCDPDPQTITVPTATAAGESIVRLVIEHITAHCTASGPVGVFRIVTIAAGVKALHSIAPASVVSDQVVGGGVVRLYADPGCEIEFIRRSSRRRATARCRSWGTSPCSETVTLGQPSGARAPVNLARS